MNEVKIFENQEFGRIRTVTIDDEPWFVGKDVATALGYENASKSIRDHVDKEDKKMGVQNVTPSVKDSLGRIQYPTWINESGVYALIFGSRLPSAKKFKHWVTSEVLPSIRRTGSYGMQTEKLMEAADKLLAVSENLAQATVAISNAVESLSQVVGRLQKEAGMGHSEAGMPLIMAENPDSYGKSRCKLESFSAELVSQVDEMLEAMVQQQNLNFSMISRFCTLNGYAISSPSVKTYYQKHFSQAF